MQFLESRTVQCLSILCSIYYMCGVSGQRVIPLTDSDKAEIVRAHNSLRSSVSPTATNMREMVYSDELGMAAQNYALMCSNSHSDDEERAEAAPSFNSVGENFFAIGQTILVINYTSYIVDSWGLEEKNEYNYNLNSCQTGKVCGHYTQITWADTTHVGCGSVDCPSEKLFGQAGFETILFICHYGPAGNVAGRKPYMSGPVCSACPTEQPECKANLCSLRGEVMTDAPPMTEATTQSPPPVTEPSTQPPPPVTEASTQPPPPVTEASTQPPPPVTEASTHPPPPVTEASTQPPPPVTEATTQPPSPVTEATTQPPPPVTEATTQPPPPVTEASTQPPPPVTEATTQPPPLVTEATTQPPPPVTEATTQPPPKTEPVSTDTTTVVPDSTDSISTEAVSKTVSTPTSSPETTIQTTDMVIPRPVITLNADSPRLEGTRLYFNFVFASPMKSVLCFFDGSSPQCSTGSAVFSVNLRTFQYHILRVKAVATDGSVIVFRRSIKTGPESLCIVNFINSGVIKINSGQVMIEFKGSGPIQSYMCSLNQAELSPCVSGQMYGVNRGHNRIKVVADGCGRNRRNAVMNFFIA